MTAVEVPAMETPAVKTSGVKTQAVKTQAAKTPAVEAAALDCRDLAVGRGERPVLDGLGLALPCGGLLALLGASGSGKTTLLDTIAGFVPPLRGEIRLNGALVSGPTRHEPPERRSVGVVFQHYALWPQLTVLDIVAYPLRRCGTRRSTARADAAALLDRLGIAVLAARRPAELSGGEQQRVALARALARYPDLFLFDEPTAHLDAHLRALVLDEVARRRAESGAAAVYATHDAAEALAIADTVAVLDGGGLAQSGTAREVYERPADLSVARLTGPACVLEVPPTSAADGSTAQVTIGSVSVSISCPPAVPSGLLLIRPDWAVLGGPLPGVAARVRFRGPHTDYSLQTPAGRIDLRAPGAPRHAEGDRVNWSLTRAWPLPQRGGGHRANG
jgi:ABC-type Fe3+/spermidine/putrescine transport system ATPase subunit